MRSDERDRVQQVWSEARHAGHDPIEQLDRHSLIVTDAVYGQITSGVLYRVAEDLENLNILHLLRSHGVTNHTALDAQRVLTEWLRGRARREEVT